MIRREGKGGSGTPRDLRHMGEKVGSDSDDHVSDWSTFPTSKIGVLILKPGALSTLVSVAICDHYGVDKTALAAKPAFFF
ncbi:hypothetical protein TNCV_1831621 [Trichonephila clavipes]|nr:hypothetical protein TNCV_1831621 [Trichonephila clavipes]